MGWYVTCEVCGKSEKYGIGCDCYRKEKRKNIARMKGCTIEEAHNICDMFDSFLIQKLRSPTGEVFYLRIRIGTGGGEYTCYRIVKELSEEEFTELRDAESDESSDENEEQSEEM